MVNSLDTPQRFPRLRTSRDLESAGLRRTVCALSFARMSTLAEIEEAVAALPRPEQEALLHHLTVRLSSRSGARAQKGWPVPPPTAIPREELQRIHALIEAEFSQAE